MILFVEAYTNLTHFRNRYQGLQDAMRCNGGKHVYDVALLRKL
jgi:hypothetical protein